MLIDFKTKNFRTYFDEANISMIPSLKRDLKETLITNGNYKFLPNAVIFGANASGKSNILIAIEMLKEFILSKTINSTENDFNAVKNMLPLCFFAHDEEKYYSPMIFSITFLNNFNEYNYSLSLLNKKDTGISVNKEILLINNNEIFNRRDNIVHINTSNNILKYYDKKMIINFKESTKLLEKMLSINLSKTSLFTEWFSSINNNIVKDITEYFFKKLLIFNNIEDLNILLPINDKEVNDKKKYFVNRNISALLRNADFGPQKIEFEGSKIENDDNNYVLSPKSVYNINGKKLIIDSELMESEGTIKLCKFFSPFINVIHDGSTLILDEFDSSINPELIVGIIKVFDNPKINKKGAQLIFTTHNPIYLNKNLFRRDEILFVEKDSKTYESKIYSLDDFNIRNDEVYLKNYLSGKYVDIPSIDFENIMMEIMKAAEDFGNGKKDTTTK
jgi:uncharacterized protein